MDTENNEKKTIELVPIGKYRDWLLKCRECTHQFQCRGPWVYEPWCPKGWEFEQK